MSRDILDTDGELVVGSLIFYVFIFMCLIEFIFSKLKESSPLLAGLLLVIGLLGLYYFPIFVVRIKDCIKEMKFNE